MFRRLSENIFTRHYILLLSQRYRVLKPVNEFLLQKMVLRTIILNLLFSVCILIFPLCFGKINWYHYIYLFPMCYIINRQYIISRLEKEEYGLLKQMENYLGEIRHFYHMGGTVEDAIYDSLEEAPMEISAHMNKIYDILLLAEEEEIEKYKGEAPNKFFVTLLALCSIAVKYGDSQINGISLFLSNLNHLKTEIHLELLKREKVKHTFSGLIVITLLPVFSLRAIEKWGIGNLPELEGYYRGSYGIGVSLLIFAMTVIAYLAVTRLKEEHPYLEESHRWLEKIAGITLVNRLLWAWGNKKIKKVYEIHRMIKRTGEHISVNQYVLRKVILFFISFFFLLFVIGNMVFVSKHGLIHRTDDFTGTSLVEEKDEIENYRKIIENYSDRYRKDKKEEEQRTEIYEALKESEKIGNEYILEVLAGEIMERIGKYQNIYFRFSYILLAGAGAFIISGIPRLIMEIKGFFLKYDKEDEVMQFQSIILMLMHIKRINVEMILDWMELFSNIFKSSIITCADEFPYDGEAALERLKGEETFPPFVRIIENLQVSDRTGIEKAFEEIASSQAYYEEKRKQDNEILISNKGVIAKVIAYVPLVFTLSLYLIVPFVLESIAQLAGYMEQMNGIR